MNRQAFAQIKYTSKEKFDTMLRMYQHWKIDVAC